MIKAAYKKQVSLLLNVLPEIAKESSFALFGGTAINLFVRNMPRLSVDIDLTYVPIEDRATTLGNIQSALSRTKERIEGVVRQVQIADRSKQGKLYISAQDAGIKIEVNIVARGTLSEPAEMTLCQKAQKDFEAFATMPVVPFGQLYGGKICAALDRQHPRDLFDIKHLLKNEGFSHEIKTGFLLALVSSERPIHELLDPHLLDQSSTLKNHFVGMSSEEFTYTDFEAAITRLLEMIHDGLTNPDRQFLLGIKRLEPVWDEYSFEHFPAVQWKLQNLQLLKNKNHEKYLDQYKALENVLISPRKNGN